MHTGKRPQSLKEAFEARYIPEPMSGCWIWIGNTRKDGYGALQFGGRKGKVKLVHRLAYELFNGDIGDKHVLHRCDNRCCVNPSHLWLGTQVDNNRDMTLKRRHYIHSKTHCKHGHRFETNARFWNGKLKRQCKVCGRIRTNKWLVKKGLKPLRDVLPNP